MAKIGLTEGFSLIPEGTHVFKITAVNYKPDFGKMEVTIQTEGGQKHIERFSLLKGNGEPNEGALNAFSYFAKTALDDFSLTEIDHTDLIGHFIECDVKHEDVPSRDNPNKTVTFARLDDKRASSGWVETAPANKTSGTAKKVVDLQALLG